jgi:hypothetical protein
MADKIISTVKREMRRERERAAAAAAIERLYLRVSFVFANS